LLYLLQEKFILLIMVITFSFVDVTRTSDSVEWIQGDPFCQTRVGNETNTFVQNADISVHEDCNEELEFNERLVLISKSKAELICFTSLLLIHIFNT